MDHPMRRKDRQLPEKRAIAILEDGEYGILSTYGEDGYPYGVPLSYVYHGRCIYFHGAGSGHKMENYSFCPRVSFCVVGKTHVLTDVFSTNYESAIVFGRIHEVMDNSKKLQALHLLVAKYAPENTENGNRYAEKSLQNVHVYCMEAEQITGKARTH